VPTPHIVRGRFVARVHDAGVNLKPGRPHYLGCPQTNEFAFGFAEHSPATIEEGVQRLARALD
jgi:DNA-binding transcriptional MocR family regulator